MLYQLKLTGVEVVLNATISEFNKKKFTRIFSLSSVSYATQDNYDDNQEDKNQ